MEVMISNWILAEEFEFDGVQVHRFHKPVIMTGDWAKDELEFTIDDDAVNHFKLVHEELNENDVSVPVLLSPEHMKHEDGDESKEWNDIKKGEVKGYFVRPTIDPDGKSAKELVAVIDMYGDKAKEYAAKYDVSIFSPPQWTDSKKKEYQRPIRHLLLTPHPIIKGLGKFESIAASFNLKGSKTMAIDFTKIKEFLGSENDVTEDSLGDLIESALKIRDDKITSLGEEIKTLKESIPNSKKEEEPAIALSPTLLRMGIENREGKIDALVGHKISAAVAKDLKEEFCDEKVVTLALSSENSKDAFDSVIKNFQSNPPILEFNERSGSQNAIALSNPLKSGDENVLLKNAKKRKELATSKNGR